MRASANIFWVLTAFFVIVGIAYGFLTGSRTPLGVETVGFPALLLCAGLSMLIAVTLTIFSRKYPGRAEENEKAEVSDEAGVQGSFSPYSWWPLWTAIGCAMGFLGVAAGWWILALGMVPLIYGVIGWVMEFSRGQHAH